MVLDNETETNHSLKRKSNPFNNKNWIVMRGWKVEGDSKCTSEYYPTKDDVKPLHIPDDVSVLVGHNIKFDLLYEMCVPGGYEALRAFYKRGGRVWDTQYAEYLLNGQQQKYQMVALDTIAESYGGRKKIDGIKILWEQGVLTSEINVDLLRDYLIGTEEEGRNSGDIGNTELVYLGQAQAAKNDGMYKAIKARMDGLCATTEMEYNGLKIDVNEARSHMLELTEEQREVAARLKAHIKFIPDEVQFNWGSPTHISCLLFGGSIKYSKRCPYIDPETLEQARKKDKQQWPIFRGKPVDPLHKRMQFDGTMYYINTGSGPVYQDIYKSGKKLGSGKFKNVTVPGELKVKWQDFSFDCPQIVKPDPAWKGKLTDAKDNPIYSIGKDVIEYLAAEYKDHSNLISDFARNAQLNKELGTYYIKWDSKSKTYKGMLTCVDPNNHIVHHSLNHTSTITSRLSSNNPNLQNIPRADKSLVKKIFCSRFKDGRMIEIDYSQLEVVVQAWLSGDTNMIRDVQQGIDFHCKRVALKYGIPYEEALDKCKNDSHPEYHIWKPRRTACKEFSFQRAYGAGIAAIALSTGMDPDDVKHLFELEEKEYPSLNKYIDHITREVEKTSEPFRDPEREFKLYRRGTYQAPTGTIYTFRSYDPPEWSKKKNDTFMPTELKNYPIQGTGGEIVQMVLGVLWRNLFIATNNFNSKALLVNTVHDCYWADTAPEITQFVAEKMYKVITAARRLINQIYNIECPVDFPAEVETGPNMYELKHLSMEH